MYYSNQTLVHKTTRKLAALNPSEDNCSQWNWQLGAEDGKTAFINEEGVVFYDDVKDYEPIYDWYDRPLAGYDRKENKYLDVTLKQYLVSDEERTQKAEAAINNKIESILKKIDEEHYAFLPFADGSMNWTLYECFKEKVNCFSLITILKEHSYNYVKRPGSIGKVSEQVVVDCEKESIFLFKRNDKLYFLHPDKIYLIKINI